MKKILIAVSILILTLSLTACGVKDKAIKEIEGIDLKAYMQEDQKDLKEFKEAYIKDIKKVKSDKEATKLLKQFKADLKTFATKEDKIKTYKELVLQKAGDKKDEAKKVLKDYEKKLNEVKSNKELDKLTKEINAKLTEKTGEAISVTTSEVETSTPAAKAYTRQTASGSVANKSRSTPRASGSKSGGHTKKRVWVVDKAAWTETAYRTETYEDTYTAYVTSDGKEFPDYSSAYAYYIKMDDEGTPINFTGCNKTVTKTRQVPYTINHPEEGHWEYR